MSIAPAVPGNANSEEISWDEESGEEPDVNELIVCVMTFSAARMSFCTACKPVVPLAALLAAAGCNALISPAAL